VPAGNSATTLRFDVSGEEPMVRKISALADRWNAKVIRIPDGDPCFVVKVPGGRDSARRFLEEIYGNRSIDFDRHVVADFT
jgi:hypothetical protein